MLYERTGGPEVLGVREVPDPVPADGAVLVDVTAAGVNVRDVYEREGRPPCTAAPPAVIGVEGAGTVVDTGERVAWLDVPGSYAGRAAAPRDELVPVPDGVDLEVAAALMMQGVTAQYLVADSCPVAEGDGAVVHSAAGGVGLLLTQLVRARGGHVLATTSTEGKAGPARAAGADDVVVGCDGFAERVRELSGGGGAAVVYDGASSAESVRPPAGVLRRRTPTCVRGRRGHGPGTGHAALQGWTQAMPGWVSRRWAAAHADMSRGPPPRRTWTTAGSSGR